jgi:hypothetical protein
MKIFLNRKADGIFSVKFSSPELNEQYAALVRGVLSGKKSVEDIYKFMEENAPGILRRNDG